MNALHLVAYIDAGTGSYILAAIASGVAGLWFFFRSWAAKVKRKVTGQPSPVYANDEELDTTEGFSNPPHRSED